MLPIELWYIVLKKIDCKSLASLMQTSPEWLKIIMWFTYDYNLIDKLKGYNIRLIKRYPPKTNDEYWNIIKNGCSIDVLKWMKENGCPLNEWTFKYAAQNGNLENMKWLKENGCPYDYNQLLLKCTPKVKEWITVNLNFT